ncbi:hypothetical protein AURDEDRAFT_164420 [Auricularia subglabra TFB-10046 SS5]|nr:hypothetical protein AURDEDRAFT_164420 [Auricularia subglabra TFB-10046 SS5]
MHTLHLVSTPTDGEIEHMADVLHESFVKGYFGGALGTSELSRALLKHHIAAALVDPAGELWIAKSDEDDDGKVIGVAVWFGPGAVYLATPEQRAVGWDQLYGQLDSDKQAWWDYFLDAFDALTETTLGVGVKRDAYHLQVIGILASRRRQGLGRSFFRAVESKAKEPGVCTCMETIGDGAVPVYEALGYEVKGPVPLKSPRNPESTLPMYAFVKRFP